MVGLRTTFTALAVASFTACAAWMMPLGLAPEPAHLKIVAFGSSSTEGVGASNAAAAYPAQLEILLKQAARNTAITVVNRGIGGEDADDMALRLASDVIARRPDLVIWQTGSNDPMRHVPLARFERETREGIVAMRQAGIRVMLMEPQWCPALDGIASADLYRLAVRQIGATMNVPVIRRSDLMRDWVRRGLVTKAEMLAPDGLHMRDKGYTLLAQGVALQVLHMVASPHGRGRTAAPLI